MTERPPFDPNGRSFTVPHVDSSTTNWLWLWPLPDESDGDGSRFSETDGDDGTPGTTAKEED